MIDGSHRADFLRLEVGLVDQRHFRRFAHDQMGLDIGLFQHFHADVCAEIRSRDPARMECERTNAILLASSVEADREEDVGRL